MSYNYCSIPSCTEHPLVVVAVETDAMAIAVVVTIAAKIVVTLKSDRAIHFTEINKTCFRTRLGLIPESRSFLDRLRILLDFFAHPVLSLRF